MRIMLILILVLLLALIYLYYRIVYGNRSDVNWRHWYIAGKILRDFFGDNASDVEHIHYEHGSATFIAQVVGEPVAEVEATLRNLLKTGQVHTSDNDYGQPVWRLGPAPGITPPLTQA